MKRLSKNAILYTTIIVIFSVELLAGYWIITLKNLDKIWAFSLHIVLVLLFIYSFRKIKIDNHQQNPNFALIALILSLILPVYGMLGIFLIYLCKRIILIEQGNYFEFDKAFLPEQYKDLIQDFDDNIVAVKRDELEIEAFNDIFRNNDKELEQNAINKLSKLINKHSVLILRKVLEKTNSDSKILAASALIEMQDNIIKKIEKLRSDLQQDPNNSTLILELARTYDLYCYLGILDPAIENYYQNLALEHYQKYLNYHPKHSEVTTEFGRLLLKTGQYEKAIEIFKKAISLTPQNPNPYIWLAEAHYNKADYDSVKKLCSKLTEFENLPDNCKEVVHWWALGELMSSN